MNKIEKRYYEETGENTINSQGEPDIDYVAWLEKKVSDLEIVLKEGITRKVKRPIK